MPPKKKPDVDVERDKFVLHTAGLANVKTCEECLSKVRQLSLHFLTMAKTGSIEIFSLLSSPKRSKVNLFN
jgi:hypothetical protein